MVALGLIVVGLLGIVVLYTRSLALNREVVNQTIAAGLAAEGIEIVKNIIDTNVAERVREEWTQNLSAGTFAVDYESATLLTPAAGQPLHFRASNNSYGPSVSGSSASAFTRSVTITFLSVTETQVTSTVAWVENGSVKSINVEDHFFNWRP